MKIHDKSAVMHTEFYAQDIRALEDLGFEVRIATRISELKTADLYFVWWWTWAFLPITLARLMRKPVLVTGVFDHMYAQGEWGFGRRPWWQRTLLEYSLKRADTNVFVSRLELAELTRRYRRLAGSYGPLTVDVEAYRPKEQERDDFVLTTAWMHAPNAARKCIPEIIRAAPIIRRAYPNIRFVIAGERESGYTALRKLAVETGVGDCIDFPGIVTREEKIDLMQRCRVYLQPTRSEGFGLATLEAMACGAAVVTSPQGAVPEIVGDTAILVDGTDPSQIADGVKRLLSDRETARKLGQAARERAASLFPYERRRRDLQLAISRLMAPKMAPRQ